MEIFLFILNSILFGVGLAMDAFSVSLANGLNEPKIKKGRMCIIAGIFGFFQFRFVIFQVMVEEDLFRRLLQKLGMQQVAAHVREEVRSFQSFIPWIALVLLLYIGGKMLIEGIKNKDGDEETAAVGKRGLLLQGIATSIDALSVGFTIAGYQVEAAIGESLIIGIVTFIISFLGLILGKKFGTKLAGKASILGGIILILIGAEIFIKGVFF